MGYCFSTAMLLDSLKASRATMNNLSTSRRAASNHQLASICLTVITAGLIWAFSAFNAAQAQDIRGGSAISGEAAIPQGGQAKNLGIRQQQIRRNQTENRGLEMKSPRGSHIKQEIDQGEKAAPQPFTDREQPIQRKIPRALA